MDIEIDIRKGVEENASVYFEKAKKLKKKIEGTKKIIEETEKKLKKIMNRKKKEEKVNIEKEKETEKRKKKHKKWFEKFRWFISSDGFLVVGGRDATQNDIIVKKHTEKDDLVLHTDMAGSPFVVIKNPDKKEIPMKTIEEAAEFCANYSRAWKLGISAMDIFYVKPEQVSKKAKSGEYLKKGAFMIYGKTNYLHPNLGIAIGNLDGEIIYGPVDSVKKRCRKYVVVKQGNKKKSDLAKEIKKLIGGNLDDIISCLPGDGVIDSVFR